MVTVEEIQKVALKPKLGEQTLLKRLFFRKYSCHFSWFFLKLGLTANQVTAIGFLFGMLGVVLFTTNNYILFMIGSCFLLMTIIVDFADGNVARYRKHKNLPDEPFRKYGSFMDSLLNLPRNFVIIALSLSFLYYYFHPLIILAIGFVSAGFCFLDVGFNGLIDAIFHKKITHRNSGLAQKIRVATYDQASLPLFLFITSFVDFIFGLKLTFYYWLYMAGCGVLLFLLELYGERKT